MQQTISTRVNFSQAVEGKISHIIWLQWSLDRTYQALTGLLSGHDNLVGAVEFLRLSGLRHRVMAEKWMKFQLVRGGQVRFEQTSVMLPLPVNLENGRALTIVLEMAMECEKRMEQQLRELHHLAGENNDMVTVEMTESSFIPAQIRMVRFLVGLLNTLQMSGKNHFLFDRLTMQPIVKRWFQLVKTGELERMSLVNGDKFITMMVRTHYISVKKHQQWLNWTEQQQQEWTGHLTPSKPIDTKLASEWSVTTDFWSL